MPTYEYLCQDCDQPLEVFQSFTDAALTECPACGGTLRKVYGSVGVVFKGSGFYRTDSRDTKSAAAPVQPKKTATGSDTTSAPSAAPASTTAPAASSASASASSPSAS